MTRSEKVRAALAYLQSHLPQIPTAAVVLGSGLGDFASSLRVHRTLSAADIPHYPVPSVAGHQGQLILAESSGTPVLLIKGRVHLYEGHTVETVTFYVHLLAALGVQTLLLTNAAGGINPHFNAGDLCLISDHLDLTFVRLPSDLHRNRYAPIYDRSLSAAIWRAAQQAGIALHQGIYAGVLGPSYETRAEIEMLRRLGADAVGMSTVKEATVAKALGLRVVAISLITNKAAGLSSERLSHDEVQRVASDSKQHFTALMHAAIQRLSAPVDTL
ncbi:MAG: purine-nucleoside phosphorylase [Chloroherpetonaceae bacterium]|nr:purine-nucleoside phosphorylase [Chloroherpetonaceae bacterium]MCS7211758.1 purine-nucleoside phosphorylase [Chloroherpetonaceae bacterium]MDW8018765.1 purine-nucleoside phosphorylase [Chloroherpetonaceae bacterium]MDW8465957.1 purine-nucleoside phosphorylase [Chloroherpetonaceae bacterium]